MTTRHAAIKSDDDTRQQTLRGHAAMLAFSAMVAGSFALGGLAAPMIDPLAVNAARFAFAMLILTLILGAQGVLKRRHFDQPWRYLILGGLFAYYFATMFMGLKTATPVSAAAVFTLTPLMAAGFGWLLLRQHTSRSAATALAVAALGAVWVIFDANAAAIAALDIGRGEVIFFTGCAAHALYIPVVRILGRGEPLMVLTLGMLAGGTIFLGALGLPAILATDWPALPMIVWITIGYLTVISGILTFYLVQYAAFRLPSGKVMAYTYLTPAWVVAWEAALGHGQPPPLIFAGVIVIVIALLILLRDDLATQENGSSG